MDPERDDDHEDASWTDAPLIDIWITKWALARGVLKARGEVTGTMVQFSRYAFAHGQDWHRTAAEAIKRAEEMRQTKLASIAKQDRALRKRDMSVVKEWK